jgi:hypothetical protein
MTAFFNALQQGYSPQQVLSYLSQAIPQFSPMIKKAQKAGYPAEQIVGFLSKNFETENRQGMSESERHAVNRRADAERTKYGLKAVGAAIATPIAARAAQSALTRALPSSLTGGISQTLLPNNPTNPGGVNPLNTGSAPTQGTSPIGIQQPQASSSQSPVSPILPQTQTPVQPEVKTIDLKQTLEKYPGFELKINDLLKTKNSPEAIAAYFKKFNPSQTTKLEKEAGKPIEDIVSEYVTSRPQEADLQQQEPVKPLDIAEQNLPKQQVSEQQEPVNPLDIEQEKIETQEAKPIEKGSTVASPLGVGDVKEIRNGKALIEIDGKKHQVDAEDLESEPEDVIEIVQNLLEIPEVDKSSIVSLFTYDPDEKKMYIQFHNGEFYKYLDVDPEKVRQIAEKNGTPVTKGKNIFGAWSPDDQKSLGATLIKEIINDPKYRKAKKGEKENTNYVKLPTLFDYWQKLRKKPKKKNV